MLRHGMHVVALTGPHLIGVPETLSTNPRKDMAL